MRKILTLLTLISIAFIFIIASYWQTCDYLYQIVYDFNNNNPEVTSKQQIDEILNEFEIVKFDSLDEEYLDYTKSDDSSYKKILIGSSYYVVKRKDINKRIVGKFRIKNFLSKDKYYKKCLYRKNAFQYWLLNKKLLYSILSLQNELSKIKCDKNAFEIRSGHRQPKRNEQAGGAKLSRHIKGEAADLQIKDINKDGKCTKADKAVVLEIVDKKVIGNKGGVGLYPNSKTVHIDVRGKKARWDTTNKNQSKLQTTSIVPIVLPEAEHSSSASVLLLLAKVDFNSVGLYIPLISVDMQVQVYSFLQPVNNAANKTRPTANDKNCFIV